MKKKFSILIVDDEQPAIDSLESLLEYQLLIARNSQEALRQIKSHSIDLVFLDITLPGLDGFEIFKEIRKYDETMDVVMLAADERAKAAVRAMELGAFHYMTKPYGKEDILLVMQCVFEKKKMTEEIISLRDEIKKFKERLLLDLVPPAIELSEPDTPITLKTVLDAYEKRVLLNVLESANWNQTKAADLLGIHRNTLLLKLEALGIRVKALKLLREAKALA